VNYCNRVCAKATSRQKPWKHLFNTSSCKLHRRRRVVRMRPRAIPLAMITTRKPIHGCPLLCHMGMGLHLTALRAVGAPLLQVEYLRFLTSSTCAGITGCNNIREFNVNEYMKDHIFELRKKIRIYMVDHRSHTTWAVVKLRPEKNSALKGIRTNDLCGNVFSHVMECTIFCTAISDVRYSQLLLFFALMERMTIRVSVYKAIFCSSRSPDGIPRYISVNFLYF